MKNTQLSKEESDVLTDAALSLLSKARDMVRSGDLTGWTEVYDRMAFATGIPTVTEAKCPHCGKLTILDECT
jgi:hypothetical protein